MTIQYEKPILATDAIDRSGMVYWFSCGAIWTPRVSYACHLEFGESKISSISRDNCPAGWQTRQEGHLVQQALKPDLWFSLTLARSGFRFTCLCFIILINWFCVFTMVHRLSYGAIMRTELFTYFCIQKYIGTQGEVCRQLNIFTPHPHPR